LHDIDFFANLAFFHKEQIVVQLQKRASECSTEASPKESKPEKKEEAPKAEPTTTTTDEKKE